MWLLLRDYFLNYLLRFPSIRKPREQVEAVKNIEVVQAVQCQTPRWSSKVPASQQMNVVFSLFSFGVKFGSLWKDDRLYFQRDSRKKKWANPDLATMSPDVHVCSFRGATFAKVHRSISGSLSIWFWFSFASLFATGAVHWRAAINDHQNMFLSGIPFFTPINLLFELLNFVLLLSHLATLFPDPDHLKMISLRTKFGNSVLRRKN